MTLLRILYNEPDPSTYAGVQLLMGDKVEVFNTGSPTIDFLTAGCVAHFRLGPDVHLGGTSSIDHFVMDGGTIDDSEPTPEQVQEALGIAKAYLIGTGELAE